MPVFLALVAATSPVVDGGDTFDFSRSYAVWVGQDRGRCLYSVTDVQESARQITETLRENYDTSLGVEILTNADTSPRCAADGVRAARNAGFRHVRIRRGTNADRGGGIPQ